MKAESKQHHQQQQPSLQQGTDDSLGGDVHINNQNIDNDAEHEITDQIDQNVVEPSSPPPPAFEDVVETPPRPPPRLSSQMSNTSKMIPLTPRVPEDENPKPERPRWFRIAYFMVGIAIFG